MQLLLHDSLVDSWERKSRLPQRSVYMKRDFSVYLCLCDFSHGPLISLDAVSRPSLLCLSRVCDRTNKLFCQESGTTVSLGIARHQNFRDDASPLMTHDLHLASRHIDGPRDES